MNITFKIVNGDVVISSSNGQPIQVEDDVKVRQDLQENFTTAKRPNGFGAGIDEIVGFVPENAISFRVNVFEAVSEAIEAMKNLQQEFNAEERPPSEQIAKTGFFNVQLSQNDPTAFFIRVDVITVDGNTITIAGQSQVIG